MNAINAKIGLQILGTLAALTSLHFLKRAYILTSHREWPGFVLVAILGLYFAYVGYLTWFRFSPRSIRHICAATLFWAFFVGRVPIKLVSQDRAMQGLLSIVLIAGLVRAYRRAWRHFSGLIFEKKETQTIA